MVSVNILTFLISPPHLVSSHPTLISDGLWMAQVDAIVSFESNLAPFLGAAHLTSPSPSPFSLLPPAPGSYLPPSSTTAEGGDGVGSRYGILTMHGDLPMALIEGSCMASITHEADFMNAWAAAERRAVELRLASSIASQMMSDEALHQDGGGGGGVGEAWKKEFFPPPNMEAFADEIKSLVVR